MPRPELKPTGYEPHVEKPWPFPVKAKFRQRRKMKIFDKSFGDDDSGPTVHHLGKWSDECSGCSCDCSDGYGCSHGAGGCEECGFTGRRRTVMWLPCSECTVRIKELEGKEWAVCSWGEVNGEI